MPLKPSIKLPALGSLWMLVAALGFAVMGAFVKLASARFDNIELVFYRSVFGFLAICIVIISQKRSIRTPVLGKQLARAWIGFCALILFFYAIAHLPLATAITLNYTSPLFLALLAPWLLSHHQTSNPRKWTPYIALVAGFIGVIFLLQPSLAHTQLSAGLIGLLSGLGAAIAYIHVKQLGQLNEPDWRTVFYFTLISSLASGLWLAFHHATLPTLEDLPNLIGLGASATFAQLAMTRAYRTGDTLIVASLAYTTVILATFLGVIIWNETLSTPEYVGIALIVASGLTNVYFEQRLPSTHK